MNINQFHSLQRHRVRFHSISHIFLLNFQYLYTLSTDYFVIRIKYYIRGTLSSINLILLQGHVRPWLLIHFLMLQTLYVIIKCKIEWLTEPESALLSALWSNIYFLVNNKTWRHFSPHKARIINYIIIYYFTLFSMSLGFLFFFYC